MDAPAPAPLPWLAPTVARALAMPHAHALLLHGAAGDGLLECANTLVQAWLCEAADGPRPCGHCGACRLLAGGLHPDLHLLMPEALRQHLGLAGADAGDGVDAESGSKSKRKPSRQIRIDEVRAAIDWVATTSSRGRAKVVLVHPAEAMNLQSANALLKTLEEPPRGARLLLTASEPAQLLPTVRSRCQVVRLTPPDAATARAWLQAQGLAQLGDGLLESLEFRFLAAKKELRQPQLLGQPRRRQHVCIVQLVAAAPEISYLDQTLVQQSVQHVVRLPKAQAEAFGEFTLRQISPLRKHPQ